IRSAKLLKAVIDEFPDAKITWGYKNGGVCEFDNALKGIFPIEILKFSYIGLNINKLMPLKEFEFDLVIDKQRRLHFTLALMLKIKYKKFVISTRRWIFSDFKPKDRRKKDVLHQELSLLEAITKKPVTPQNSIIPDERHRQLADKFFTKKDKTIGLVPGAGHPSKCWLHYKELAKKLNKDGFQIVIFLGPSENSWYAEYKKELPFAIFPLQETKNLDDAYNKVFYTIEIGKKLDLAVTNDCGTSHMLAEANIPQIVLFGKTNSNKHRLFGEHYNISSKDIDNTDNINNIPVEYVYDKVISLYKKIDKKKRR
ncbi:MAG: glycosyltransferase family 9 protein, partial [Campylobacteraceae bacterium]|nr:glycosyltransferase family 9 protein [Campylobacteraceae bacterium]